MNSLREIGYIFCVILVVTGIFLMLLPSGNSVKTVKFSVHLFLLLAVITPFLKNSIDFSSYSYNYQIDSQTVTKNLTEVYNKQILKSFENELKLRIEAILKEYKISPEKIEISMNVNADRSIDISNITIVFKEIYRNKCDKAISKINEMFSVVTKITFV